MLVTNVVSLFYLANEKLTENKIENHMGLQESHQEKLPF